MAEDVQVNHNEQKSRFECTVDGAVAMAEYELEPGRIVFVHTEVPEQLSGRGIAGQLVRRGLEHAREQKLRVVPQCSYVASFIKRNPEYQELVASD